MTPYRCLHVPLQVVSPLARVVGFWPSWLVLALAAVLAYRTWGPWVLLVPALVVIVAGVVILVGDFTAAREADAAPLASAAISLTVAGTTVLVAPVAASSVHLCRRCDASRATLMITVRGESIPACDLCQVPALYSIYQAATAAVLEAAVPCGGR